MADHCRPARLVIRTFIGASSLALATSVLAQSSPSTAEPQVKPVSADEPVQDIVVTARKRSENLRDVPVAITALSGDTLQRKNITQLIDLPAITPNFVVSYGAIQPFTFIRGFGSGALASFEQSVGKFIDNVSYGRDADSRVPIFDVERVEILKGPQVLTFGNSATVGAVNITTKKPGDKFEADGSVGYEFLGRELQTQFGVTAPLTQGISLRLAGIYQDLAKGRYDNPVKGRHEPNSRNYAVRPSLRVSPLPGLQILLHAEVDRMTDKGVGLVPIAQPLIGNTNLWPVAGDDDHRYANYELAPYYTRELARYNANLYQIDVNYRVLGGTITSATAWRDFDTNMQFGNDGLNHAQTYFNAIWQHYHQFSQELRFGGTYGRLDLTAGGYYQRDTHAIDVLQEFTRSGFGVTGLGATPVGRVTDFDQKNRVYSGFADLTYRLTDRLSISGGARYSDIRKIAGQAQFATGIIPGIDLDTTRAQLQAARDPSVDAAFAAIIGTPQHSYPLGHFQLAERHWQPQAIAQYEIAPKNKVYVKFVRGAKVGGFDYLYTGTTVTDGTFKPEFATMFEGGAKGLILENHLEYALALFRTTYTSLQQSVLQGTSFVVSNVGKARSQGVELELNYRPSSQWRLGFSGSYLDAKFVDFKGAACSTGQLAGIQPGCSGAPTSQDLSGTPTQFASKWTGTVSADYTRPVGSGGNQIAVGASLFARSKYNAGAYNDPRMEQKGYAQVDAHFDFGAADGRWTASLFGRNLNDKRLLEYATSMPGASTAIVGTYSRGRQIGLKLSFAMR